MHEGQILNIIETITFGDLNDQEKSIIVADVKSELSGTRLAGSISALVLQKINDLRNGMYKESQIQPNIPGGENEPEHGMTPFEITNQDEIDKFLEKMSNKDFKGDAFGDTWEYWHPTENMYAEGLPKHRSNFNVQN